MHLGFIPTSWHEVAVPRLRGPRHRGRPPAGGGGEGDPSRVWRIGMGTWLGYPASRRWGSRRPGDILNSIVVCCMRSGGLQSRVLGHRSPVACVVRAGTVLSRKRSTGSSPTASMAPALSSIPPSFTISSPRVPVAGRPASVCDGETFRPRFGPQGGSMLFGSPPDGWVARVPPPQAPAQWIDPPPVGRGWASYAWRVLRPQVLEAPVASSAAELATLEGLTFGPGPPSRHPTPNMRSHRTPTPDPNPCRMPRSPAGEHRADPRQGQGPVGRTGRRIPAGSGSVPSPPPSSRSPTTSSASASGTFAPGRRPCSTISRTRGEGSCSPRPRVFSPPLPLILPGAGASRCDGWRRRWRPAPGPPQRSSGSMGSLPQE